MPLHTVFYLFVFVAVHVLLLEIKQEVFHLILLFTFLFVEKSFLVDVFVDVTADHFVYCYAAF